MSARFKNFSGIYQILRAHARRLNLSRNGLNASKKGSTFSRSNLQFALTLPFVTTVHCWTIPGFGSWGGNKKEVTDSTVNKPVQSGPNPVIVEADRLYSENDTKALYAYLNEHKDSEDAEILWRLARAARDMGKNARTKEEMKEMYYKGLACVTRALELDETNFAVHKWYAILLSYVGEIEGTKQKIANAFKVKEHFLKAAELNPLDATTVHSLGVWYFSFAELKWYERKIANALYGELPTGTFQEALEYFLKAEEIDPNFYSMNLAKIGETYMKLQDAKSAYTYLARAYHYPIKTADDKEAHYLAERLLKMLGVKGSPQLETFAKNDSENMAQ